MTRSVDPYLDAGMRGFILNFARSNHWRVASWIELDDLIQEGWVCYYKCRRRYAALDKPDPDRDNRRHMMALVKTSFRRRLDTLASQRTASVPEVSMTSMGCDGADVIDRIAGDDQIDVTSLIVGAPQELVDLVSILVRDASAFARDSVGVRETTAQRDTRVRVGVDGVDRFRRTRIRVGGDGRVRRDRRARRETTNEMMCRILGLDPDSCDVRSLITSYLK